MGILLLPRSLPYTLRLPPPRRPSTSEVGRVSSIERKREREGKRHSLIPFFTTRVYIHSERRKEPRKPKLAVPPRRIVLHHFSSFYIQATLCGLYNNVFFLLSFFLRIGSQNNNQKWRIGKTVFVVASTTAVSASFRTFSHVTNSAKMPRPWVKIVASADFCHYLAFQCYS